MARRRWTGLRGRNTSELLLAKHAQVNAKNNNEETPLRVARLAKQAMLGEFNQDLVDLLRRYGGPE